ncbi:MAG: efflux RND transporter periplasmic adaptor subunit [bacterium]
MKKRKLLVIVLIITAISAGAYFFFSHDKNRQYQTIKVGRGDVAQEISESGSVKSGEEVRLGFKTAEKIKELYIKVGDIVQEKQLLATLGNNTLLLQLGEAQAAKESEQAQLAKLLAGSSAEDIKVAETAAENAEDVLYYKQQKLEDVKAVAAESLSSSYDDALTVLDDAYTKSHNAFNDVRYTYLTYFSRSDQASLKVKESMDQIENDASGIKIYLDAAQANKTNEKIEIAILETETRLEKISQNILLIRNICDEPFYREVVSAADKTSLETHRTNLNTALTNLGNSRQAISAAKTTNIYNINNAEAEVVAADGALNKARDELEKIKSPARAEDIVIYRARIAEVDARIGTLRNQISEATLLSPVAGEIVRVNKRVGEIVQPGEVVISLLPLNPFQVEVNIYEEDIVKVKIDNPVDIKLTAFAEKTFNGKVLAIDPAEMLIDGVVYYKVTIIFGEVPVDLKPGMTADVSIRTASKEDVLVIPEKVVTKKDGKLTVNILKDGITEEREITLGLKGNDYTVEVLSGLQEGEEIVVESGK